MRTCTSAIAVALGTALLATTAIGSAKVESNHSWCANQTAK